MADAEAVVGRSSLSSELSRDLFRDGVGGGGGSGGESDGGSGRMLRGAVRNALNATRRKL